MKQDVSKNSIKNLLSNFKKSLQDTIIGYDLLKKKYLRLQHGLDDKKKIENIKISIKNL